MFKKQFSHIVAFSLLVLMFFKVSALHVYGHDDGPLDTIENCEICDLAIENQNAENLFQEVFSIELPNDIAVDTTIAAVLPQTSTTTSLHFTLFGRPPPALLQA